MFLNNWKKDMYAIPNLLSLLRLALIPVYMTIYLGAQTPGDHYLAGSILTLSCLTDGLDGWIARRYDMATELGKVLDPLADKATQLTLAVCLSLRHRILYPVLLLLVIKEAFQLGAGLICLRRGQVLSGTLWTGKVCTAVLFVSFIGLVLFPELPNGLVPFIALLDLAALDLSFLSYVLAYFGSRPRLQDLE